MTQEDNTYKSDKNKNESAETPVRGSLRLDVRPSSPLVTAGSDFSIFVIIQNPFDVPITIYQVQTHIPVELIDVNRLLLEKAKRLEDRNEHKWYKQLGDSILELLTSQQIYSGVAQAVGTNFDPIEQAELFNQSINFSDVHEPVQVRGLNVIGMQLNFPENPSSEEMDQIFQRIKDYQIGLIPVTLQSGDSIVKQFALKTRKWLLFTPLAHTFQIQVNYSSDGREHADTMAYEQSIQSTIGAMATGAMLGAIIGSLLKTLTATTTSTVANSIQAIIISILASVIVIIAFARKSTAQPIVSVEDFWGGMLIGFSTGYLGFEQFSSLFSGA